MTTAYDTLARRHATDLDDAARHVRLADLILHGLALEGDEDAQRLETELELDRVADALEHAWEEQRARPPHVPVGCRVKRELVSN